MGGRAERYRWLWNQHHVSVRRDAPAKIAKCRPQASGVRLQQNARMGAARRMKQNCVAEPLGCWYRHVGLDDGLGRNRNRTWAGGE